MKQHPILSDAAGRARIEAIIRTFERDVSEVMPGNLRDFLLGLAIGDFIRSGISRETFLTEAAAGFDAVLAAKAEQELPRQKPPTPQEIS